jgi:hypothetical protein
LNHSYCPEDGVQPHADHGVAVVQLRNGKNAFWREYQRKGSPSFADFLKKDGKKWQWTIRNYP